jgi:VanZ family protein
VAGWVAVTLYFSSAPHPYAGVEPPDVTDVVAHVVGFAVLMLLVTRWACHRAGHCGLRPVLLAALACLAYSVFDELHQIPIPGRSFEWTDLVADAGGVAVGAIAFHVYRLGRGLT